MVALPGSIQHGAVCELRLLRAFQIFDLSQFYDYCLTVRHEVLHPHLYGDHFVSPCFQMRYVWKTRFTVANTLFAFARYPAFLTAILVLLPVRSPQILLDSTLESHYAWKPKSSVVMSNVKSCKFHEGVERHLFLTTGTRSSRSHNPLIRR